MPSCCVAASPETANLAFARPGSPTAEAEVLNTFQCGFESHPGHQHVVTAAHRDAFPTAGLGPSGEADLSVWSLSVLVSVVVDGAVVVPA